MAKPENPLSRYNTYSYHHILMVAATTQVLEFMSSSSFPVSSVFKSRGGSSRFGVKKKRITAQGREILSVVDAPSGASTESDFVVIVDGTSDAEIFIDSVSWDSVFTPRDTPHDVLSFTSMAVEGQMTIIEPKGARLFNIINEALRQLGIDITSAVFILKTVFVGRSENGVESMITNVQPLGLTLYDMQAEFDASGATYSLNFVGISNGTAKLPQFYRGIENGAQTIPCYRTDPSTGKKRKSTLKEGLADLFSEINDGYNNYVAKLEASVASSNAPPPLSNFNITDRYRLISYEFVLDPAYDDPEYILDQFKGPESEELDFGNLTLEPGASIENAINRMMQSCSKVQKDATAPTKPTKENDTAYVYKISTSIVSHLLPRALVSKSEQFNNDSDKELNRKSFKIVYMIRRYAANAANPKNFFTDENFKPDPGNTLELDYVFTGKNVDILDMNMKLDAGYLMFFALSNNNSIPSPEESVSADISGNTDYSPGNQEFDPLNELKYKVLGTGLQIKDYTANHAKDTNQAAAFRTVLNNVSGLSALETKISIRGHLSLLEDTSTTPNQEIRRAELVNAASAVPGDVGGVAVDWQSQPALVKVNIRMPSGDSDNPYDFEPFWYQGYYYLLGVKHIFEGGTFTQELDMMAMRVNPFVGKVNDEPNPVDDIVDKFATPIRDALATVNGTGSDQNG